eukprot:TRINITY_DN5480_c0_g4_i2.p1 TRINITY_DN5480_c0_g4~~TRINITY_DN5480_c0_g4_i2.p1  ORF type:complete len:637 (+),score=89.87 TRINITY_DN5480_c0_g4_i2:1601-3511(+)
MIKPNKKMTIEISRTKLVFVFCAFVFLWVCGESACSRGCDTALASYYVWNRSNLTFISSIFGLQNSQTLAVNPGVPNQDFVLSGARINVSFTCGCINGDYLGQIFPYQTQTGDTYKTIAETYFSNLTTTDFLQRTNRFPQGDFIPTNGTVNVTVNCSCGDASVSSDYGLFMTYPLRPEDSLSSIVSSLNVTPAAADLLLRYNQGVNFSRGEGLVFIPVKDRNGNFHSLSSSTGGISGGAIAGISVGGVSVALLLAVCIYFGAFRRKKGKDSSLIPSNFEDNINPNGSQSALGGTTESVALVGSGSSGLTGITVDKSVEFPYEELAKATDDFSLANKIGEGGFGAVYYAELRGEKAAIKKMDMQASREFLAELKVLTRVHHLNLVRLIGFCTEGSLFLVYEFIENGNLNQHLRGSGREPLTWPARVQIALDSARGLEYIHEHTVPMYIHRDIKSANILIDNNFHAKVADFGLTKLTEVGSTSLPTRLVGTFGYMPPEYAQFGDVSSKVDVYAFGVVLYELISAKEAVVKTGGIIANSTGSAAETTGLVALFDSVLSGPEPREDLCRLIDQRLGDNYPLDSVYKMAQLAKACTQENPQLRPSMRSLVVALMTLSSTTEEWDVRSFYENQGLVNLMSGR